MKISKFLVVFIMVVLAFMVFRGLFSKMTNPSVVDRAPVDNMDSMSIGRKLKENGHNSGSGMGSVSLEDYHPVDPSPSSKASIKPGPIEHGTPLIPYIPAPIPPSPSPPKEGG